MLEFTILMAFMMSIVAISIDALLPALDFIRADIPMNHANHAQFLISAIFLGLAVGQLICGPLSDAIGRKKILYGGITLYLVGSFVCLMAQTLPMLIAGRIIQGLGVAGPYISVISIVRDKFSGNEMAKVMSLIMLIFIMVPAIAPSLGQLMLWLGTWRDIFSLYIIYAAVIGVWVLFRLEETLPRSNRIKFSLVGFKEGFKTVVSHGNTMRYTLCMGLFFGSFVGYLNSSQQIFQNQYHSGKLFIVYFGVLALVFGLASLCNSRFVMRLGMDRICRSAAAAIVGSSALFLLVHLFYSPSLPVFMLYAGVLFFCFGLVFGNINAMAMEPMGHVAGIASAVIGAMSSIVSLILGTWIGQLYNGTAVPVTMGFFCLCGIAYLILLTTPKRATEVLATG